MSEQSDRLRSLVRRVADRAVSATKGRLPLEGLVRSLRAIKNREVFLDARTLNRALSRAEGMREMTLRLGEGELELAFTLADGRSGGAVLSKLRCQFAPMGAKEVGLTAKASPDVPEVALRAVIAALFQACASRVWPGICPVEAGPHGGVIAERSAGEEWRADLRSIPEVRAAVSHPGRRALIEGLAPRSLRLTPEGVVVALRLPGLE